VPDIPETKYARSGLVVGSRIGFEDRGVHRLKGVDDDWQLLAVATIGD
jgi:hypothetical protein